MSKVPITIITGMLGAGKTKITNSLIRNKTLTNCKVLIYQPAAITIVEEMSTKRRYKKGKVSHHAAHLAKLITTQEQLIKELISHSKDRQPIDEIIIELAVGVSPQLLVEELYHLLKKYKLEETFYTQSIVSVIDAEQFWFDYTSNHYVLYTDDRMEHTFAEVMISQIEFCSHIIFNKCNFISKESLDETVSFIKKLQPKAQLIFSTDGNVASHTLHSVDAVDINQLKSNIGWKLELKHSNFSNLSIVGEYNVDSFVYESHSPIHLEKLEKWFQTFPSELLRSAGYLWIISESNGLELLFFSQVGASVITETVDEDYYQQYGDTTRTKLVFFGFDLEDDDVIQQLNDCLISDNDINQTVI
ncbi:CobW family GTP-binding protein [Alkalihalobacterium elongatum]|uniref:CobW family GTP-binding protein n=1 Tax=Alkalihalobacterium elongatum TaxID=2675466 RepID=UPI001C1FA345|nr:GTP-binding protein [Alkalihalobacterium elongatum]